MSAKTTKKVSNISSKPAKRAAAKDHPKQLAGRTTAAGKSSAKVAGKSKEGPKVVATVKVAKPVPKSKSAAVVAPTAKGKPVKPEKAKAVAKPSKPTPKPPAKAAPAKQSAGTAKTSPKAPSGKPPAKTPPAAAKQALKALAAKAKPAPAADKPKLDKKLSKEAEKKALAKAKDAEKKALAKAKDAEKKARDAEKKAREKDAQRAALAKKQEAERKKQEAERKKQEAERAKAALELEKKREAEKKARDAEREKALAEKEAAREVARQATEAEKQRKLQEKEAARLAKEQERLQQKAQRDAEREELRRQKEEEKAKRDAEREAYRKAKEAEREKIRAVKEAARRALEGRIAEQTRNANKLGGGRSTTTRIYSPKAIPDQSGTTRRVQGTIAMMGMAPTAAANILAPTGGSEPPDFGSARSLSTPHPPAPVETPVPPSDVPAFVDENLDVEVAPPSGDEPTAVSTTSAPAVLEAVLPEGTNAPNTAAIATATGATDEETAHANAERAQSSVENVEERYRAIEERLKHVPEVFRRDYQETIDMSWIHHDSALEGVVYTFQELKTAIDPSSPVVTDSSLQPVIDEIRRHKAAIELVRDMGERKRAPITVDTVKKIYVTLHPEEGDVKTVKYRRDIPQHRLYFHEYAHPEKVPQKVRQVIDWLNGPEPKKLKSPIRVAARVHYELLRAFPFQNDSGKVARLVMNLILIRAGHPPAIIHSTERQRYYEALKGALPILVQMVTESILNALSSIEKLLDEQEAKLRS